MPWIAIGLGILILGSFSVVKNTMPDNDFFKFDNLFQNAGKKYGVNWKWLKAICMNESDLGKAKSTAIGLKDPTNINGSKSFDGLSWGIMQVTLRTAKGMDPKATEVKLNDPIYSVDLAARYVRDMKNIFKESDARYVEWVIKSYNQGSGNTRKEQASGKGYAQTYWERFQRNLKKIEEVQP